MAFHEDLVVRDPVTRHPLTIPGVSALAGNSLWLPLNVSLGADGLCRECSNFSTAERVVYATAELLTMEFENGILAMEFAAPEPAEVVLQLAREPVGPYLAAGKPTKFDWDEKTFRARLSIPAGKDAGNRVRVGLAIEAPETSAFFNDARRLMIGQKNLISTVYSSAQVASRSRLRLPEGFTAVASIKSPNEIDYTVGGPRRCRAWRLGATGAGGRWRAARPGTRAAFPPGLHPADPGVVAALRYAVASGRRAAGGSR